MQRVFTAWGKKDDAQPSAMCAGDGPPRFANGELDPDCEKLFWRIVVGSWEEASAVFNLRNGWEPYAPMGRAAPCPRCGSQFYPEGSGQCWHCDHIG